MKYNAETHTKEIRDLFETIKDRYSHTHKYARELWLSDATLKIYWEQAENIKKFVYFINYEINEYEEHQSWLESINKMFDDEWED